MNWNDLDPKTQARVYLRHEAQVVGLLMEGYQMADGDPSLPVKVSRAIDSAINMGQPHRAADYIRDECREEISRIATVACHTSDYGTMVPADGK